MSYIARAKRKATINVFTTCGMIVGLLLIAQAYPWVYILVALYTLELGLRLRQLRALYRVARSPWAYLIELEAACNNGELTQ